MDRRMGSTEGREGGERQTVRESVGLRYNAVKIVDRNFQFDAPSPPQSRTMQ